jgi:hypothetical protein
MGGGGPHANRTARNTPPASYVSPRLKIEKLSAELVARSRALVVFVLAVVAPQEVSRVAGKPNAFGFAVWHTDRHKGADPLGQFT